MSSISVFPGLVSDVDCVVMRHLDDDSQVVLSGVSQLAYTRFSNGVYFQNSFKRQYAQIPGISLITLTTYHPSNCWKVSCCLLSSGAFKVNKSFLEEANLDLRSPLEKRLKEICGSSDQDLNSLIHQAGIAREESRLKSKEAEIAYKHAYKLAAASHTGEELGAMVFLCLEQPAKFISENDRALEERFSEEELKIIKLDLFPCYQAFAHSAQLNNTYSDRDGKCKSLRKERDTLRSQLDAILDSHKSCLKKEFSHAMEVRHLDLFTKCSELLSIPEDQRYDPENLRALLNLINSFSPKMRKDIWEALYNKCAGGIQEEGCEAWAKNNFHKLLAPLFDVIKEGKEVLERNIHQRSVSP